MNDDDITITILTLKSKALMRQRETPFVSPLKKGLIYIYIYIYLLYYSLELMIKKLVLPITISFDHSKIVD